MVQILSDANHFLPEPHSEFHYPQASSLENLFSKEPWDRFDSLMEKFGVWREGPSLVMWPLSVLIYWWGNRRGGVWGLGPQWIHYLWYGSCLSLGYPEPTVSQPLLWLRNLNVSPSCMDWTKLSALLLSPKMVIYEMIQNAYQRVFVDSLLPVN